LVARELPTTDIWQIGESWTYPQLWLACACLIDLNKRREKTPGPSSDGPQKQRKGKTISTSSQMNLGQFMAAEDIG